MSGPAGLCPLTAQDAEAAAALERDVPDGWSGESIRQTLADEHACCLAARCGEALAGFCLCSTVLDEASLYAVTVAPAFRRQGVGRALLERLFAALAARGVRTLFLEVRSRNAPALALYEKLGFARCGLRRGFYSAPPDDAVLMAKKL